MTCARARLTPCPASCSHHQNPMEVTGGAREKQVKHRLMGAGVRAKEHRGLTHRSVSREASARVVRHARGRAVGSTDLGEKRGNEAPRHPVSTGREVVGSCAAADCGARGHACFCVLGAGRASAWLCTVPRCSAPRPSAEWKSSQTISVRNQITEPTP